MMKYWLQRIAEDQQIRRNEENSITSNPELSVCLFDRQRNAVKQIRL